MISWFGRLDDLLRGKITSPERLVEGKVELSLRQFVPLAILLGATYGFFMGWYALSVHFGGAKVDPQRWLQIIASMAKLPALFLLTLVVTFPSLYVFNTLVGCGPSFVATLRLLVGTVAVNVAVAASLGPILGFFTLSTTSYPFMVLLNVVLLAISGFVALAFLLHTLRRLAHVAAPPISPRPTAPVDSEPSGQEPSLVWQAKNSVLGPIERLPAPIADQASTRAKNIFQIWLLIYSLVGVQMGWLLRPFIGRPDIPFEWFRVREGNFFTAVISCIKQLADIH